MRAGEVFGHLLNQDRQHHAGDHRQHRAPPATGNFPQSVLRAKHTHVVIAGCRKHHTGHDGRIQKAPGDRLEGVAAILHLRSFHKVRADHRRQHTDAAHHQREYEPLAVARHRSQGQAQYQAGHDGDLVRLKDVRRHAGAIADVVTHQVGNHGRIARIVLFQALFHFAHQIRTHVGRLRKNTTAHAHKQRQQRAAKTKAQQRIRRCLAQHNKDDGAAEQAQAICKHAGDGAGAVRNAQRTGKAVAALGCHAHVALYRHAHANLAHRQREACAHHKRYRPRKRNQQRYAPRIVNAQFRKMLHRFGCWRHNVHRQEQRHGQHRNQRHNAAHLPVQVSIGAGLDPAPHFLHFFSALVLAQNLVAQKDGVAKPHQRHRQHQPDCILFEWI